MLWDKVKSEKVTEIQESNAATKQMGKIIDFKILTIFSNKILHSTFNSGLL